MTSTAMRDVLDQYFTSDEQQRWQDMANSHFPPTQCTTYTKQWETLIGQCEDALRRQVTPESAEAAKLLANWKALQQPLQEATGPELWAKANRMYLERDNWETSERKLPFSPDVQDFIISAARHQAATP
ncbi:TipAS antibiotic-recognition domain-containing protein [Gluconobacter sp. OJB]|uniref:TipAS antibiotic-recognition domain-containing protein n=1 Tax=Gluconobacter sp. OJB TaxID=3145196 RepID=UPI0031F85469